MGGRVPEGFGQLRILVGQGLDQFLELLVPLVQFPLGGFQGDSEVFFGQVQELLIIILQCFGGGQFDGLAELGFGRFQQIVGRSRPLQLAVQAGYLGVEAGYFLRVAGLGVGYRLVALGLQSGNGSPVGGRLGCQPAFGAELMYEPPGRAADQQTDDDADDPFHMIKPPVGKTSGLTPCYCSTTGQGAPPVARPPKVIAYGFFSGCLIDIPDTGFQKPPSNCIRSQIKRISPYAITLPSNDASCTNQGHIRLPPNGGRNES